MLLPLVRGMLLALFLSLDDSILRIPEYRNTAISASAVRVMMIQLIT